MLTVHPFIGASFPTLVPIKQTIPLINQTFSDNAFPFAGDATATVTISDNAMHVVSTLDWYGAVATFSLLPPARRVMVQGSFWSDSDDAVVALYSSHWDLLAVETTDATSPTPFALTAFIPDDGVILLRVYPGVAGSTVSVSNLRMDVVSPQKTLVNQTFTVDRVPFVDVHTSVVASVVNESHLQLESLYQPWVGIRFALTADPGTRFVLRVRTWTDSGNRSYVDVRDNGASLKMIQCADTNPTIIEAAFVAVTGTMSITLGNAFPGFSSFFDRFVLEQFPDAPA